MSRIKVDLKHQLTGHKAGIFALKKISYDSFISGDGAGAAIQWNINEPEKAKLVASVPSNIFSIEYIEQTNTIVLGTFSGNLYFLDAANRKQISIGEHHKKGVFALKIVDGNLLAASGDGKLSIWDTTNFKLLDSIEISKESLRCLLYNTDSNNLFIGSSDNTIHQYNWESKKPIRILSAHENSVFTYEALSDNISISGGRDAHLKVWNKAVLIHSIPAHMYTINHIKSIFNGEYFATASRDKTLKFWNAANYDLLKVIDNTKQAAHKASVNKLLWFEEQKILVSASDDRSIIVWQVSTNDA